jgi:EAL domain-containing protein (putative c-di-GMP-specific phosphodiesterase class I)
MEQGKPLKASDTPLVDFDAVCQKIRAAVEPARSHSVSLHDEVGDVLWLSESSMGPDEHNAVIEAAETLANPSAAAALAFDLGDSRSALMVRVVNNRRAMVGVVMIIMDTRLVSQGPLKLVTPKLQRVLVEFAATRPDRGPAPTNLALEPPPPPVSPPSPRTAIRPDSQRPVVAPAPKAHSAAPAAPPARAAGPPIAAPPARAVAPPAAFPPAPAPVVAAPTAPAAVAPAPRAPAAPAAAPRSPAPAQRSSSVPPRSNVPPAQTSSATLPFSAGPRSISAQVQQIASRPPARPPRSPSPARANPGNLTRRARDTSSAVSPSPKRPAVPAGPEIPELPEILEIPTAPVMTFEDAAELPPARTGASPEIDRLHAALRKSPIALYVQRLIPLAKGGQLKRYEVLLRSGLEDAPNAAPYLMLKTAVDNGLGSMIDRRVLAELVSWLIRHPETCQADEVMFSVNLTSTALSDEHFIKFVELCLSKSSLPKATIAFEIDASTTTEGNITEVAEALHGLGCPLILDDFTLRTECLELLRLPGLRYVKLAPEMTAKMRTDKVSQAAITAVVQMARVLGMHTVAKRTDTTAEQDWLTALGVDFVQSNFISAPVTIDSLAKPFHTKI